MNFNLNEKKIKILRVTPVYHPVIKFGGIITAVHYINTSLVKQGMDVTVYTTNIGLEEKVTPNTEVYIDGVKVVYFKYENFFDFLSWPPWAFSYSMTKTIKNNLPDFDVVHLSFIWNYPAAVSYHFCKKYRKPYIVSAHGALYPFTFSKKKWKKLPYYNMIAKKILNNAATIHYTTKDEATQTHNFLKLKNEPTIISSGIDLSEFSNLPYKNEIREIYPVLKNKKVLLFVGRISWIKGLDLFIKVFSELAKEKDDLHFLIVGEDAGNGYKEQVKRWIKDLSLESKVTFTGILKGKEKIMAYAGSDIFVLPSYMENFGMVVVEAMACKIPAVISNKVGISEDIKINKAGIVVDLDVESFYKGVKLLLEDDNLRKEIGNNGFEFARNFYNIENVSSEMIKMYNRVISG